MKDYYPEPDLLKDRVILVTGAGGGIGRVASKTFAQHGATVILLGRTPQTLEKTYDEIAEIIGISNSNVGVKLNRIKQKLEKIIKSNTL